MVLRLLCLLVLLYSHRLPLVVQLGRRLELLPLLEHLLLALLGLLLPLEHLLLPDLLFQVRHRLL